MISLDITLVYQVIGFLVLLLMVSRLLTRPFLKVMAEREQVTDGARREAVGIDASVVGGMEEYERRIKAAKGAGLEEWGRIRLVAAKEEQSIIEEARGEAAGYLCGVRSEIEAQKVASLGALKAEAGALSRAVAEKVLSRRLLSLLLPVVMLLMPALSFASDSAHGDGAGSSGMIWKVGNFIVLLVLLYFAWKKVVRPALEKRGKEIENEIAEARKLKESALAREKEYRAKLALLDREVADIQSRLRSDGEAEKERIIKEAREAAVRIKDQARRLVDQEVQKARVEIEREVSLLAVELAEELLKKEVSRDDQKRLVADYMERLRLN